MFNILDLSLEINRHFWYAMMMWFVVNKGENGKLTISFEDLKEYWRNPTYVLGYNQNDDRTEITFFLDRKEPDEVPQ